MCRKLFLWGKTRVDILFFALALAPADRLSSNVTSVSMAVNHGQIESDRIMSLINMVFNIWYKKMIGVLVCVFLMPVTACWTFGYTVNSLLTWSFTSRYQIDNVEDL